MLCVPCYVLLLSRAHTWRTLRPDFRWVESTFGNTNRLESSRFESIRQNFSPPCAFIRDLTSGKWSSAKRTSGESEVFDPRADSNRLCLRRFDSIWVYWTWVVWLTHSLTGCLTDWRSLTDRLSDWLTHWLAVWLTHSLTDWLSDWLTDSLTGCLTDWLTHSLTDRLSDWLTDWMAVWLTDWLLCLLAWIVQWYAN